MPASHAGLGAPTSQTLCVIRLPRQEDAPAYRRSLSADALLRVEDFGNDVAGVVPVEGPGATREYFRVERLCAAETDLRDPETWAALRKVPPEPRSRTGVSINLPTDAYAVIGHDEGIDKAIYALGLEALSATDGRDLERILQTRLTAWFERFPRAVLLYVTISPVLIHRLTFARSQLAIQLTPDLRMTPGQLEAFSQMTITQGIDAAALIYLPLLALSPCALGFMIPALPHSLVFCFGEPLDLRRQHPLSLASQFRPRVFGSPQGLERRELMSSVTASDGEELVRWWVGRLNRIYSHIADPTRWVDSEWRHDAAAQTAWFVTFERLLGDAVSLFAEPQATDLHRVQVAFDLLDKAPPLLGYSRSDSSNGFCALLRREQSLRRLREAYASMPGDLGTRLGDEAERLFDGLYAKVRENTLRHRLTEKGADWTQESRRAGARGQ